MICVLSISGSALGNPVGFSISPTIYLLFAYLLLAANLPVNLLFFSGALLIISKIRGPKVGGMQERTSQYLWTIILTMLIVSIVGAFIDIFIVFNDYFSGNPVFESYSNRFAIATGLIFLSILVPSHFLIGLRLESNLIVSAALAFVNPVFWYLIYPLDLSILLVVAAILIVLPTDAFLLRRLAVWHREMSVLETEYLPRLSGKALTRISVTYFCVLGISFLLMFSLWGFSGETDDVRPTAPLSSLHLSTTAPPPNVPPYSVKLYFGGFTRDVTWSDLRIDLTDGVGKVSWYPSTEGLSGGATISYCCGVSSLGSMTVTCNTADVLGDGIPQAGDTINLTATSDATFLATQNYTISVIYIPDGGFVCSLTFNGVPLVVS